MSHCADRFPRFDFFRLLAAFMVAAGSGIIAGCSHSTEPSPSHSYVVWHEGDVRQLIEPSDSATILIQVMHNVKRQDNVEVIPMLWTYGTFSPDTQYYCIRDGFFMSTSLKPDTSTANPYGEQRLGKVNPVNGDSWTVMPGMSTIMTAVFFQEYQTGVGPFKDVFGFLGTQTSAGITDTLMMPLYARDVGYIGTLYGGQLLVGVRLVYLKSGTLEKGSMLPAKNPIYTARLSKAAARRNAERMILGLGGQ